MERHGPDQDESEFEESERRTTMNADTYRFRVGDFDCMAASDGTFAYPDQSFFVNASGARLEEMLQERGARPGEILAPWTCLYIDTGQHRVLVDTGGGAGLAPTVGKLLSSLRAEGIEPGDVDTVILTHGHPDHIGGNTDAEGEPTFPNARHVMWKDDWHFWTSQPDLSRLQVDDDLAQLMIVQAGKNLPPIRSQLDLLDRETEIVPGITAVEAPGHTSGHMALVVSSGSEQLLHISDAALDPIHLQEPDWYPAFDLAPDQARATRRDLLERAAATRALVLACHFPFPGLGHVIRRRDDWQWRPVEQGF
jgi:glyoxylase-like metal-dependent hydrolase (beta-lactamase superfamily II)